MDSLSHHLLLSCSPPPLPFFQSVRSLTIFLPRVYLALWIGLIHSLRAVQGSLLLRRLSCSFYIVFTSLYWDKKIWKYWGPPLYRVRWIRVLGFFLASQPQGEYCGEKKCKKKKKKNLVCGSEEREEIYRPEKTLNLWVNWIPKLKCGSKNWINDSVFIIYCL